MPLLGRDRLFALVRLRQVSLGYEVELELACPNMVCGARNYLTVNLDDIEVTPYPEEREFDLRCRGPAGPSASATSTGTRRRASRR